MYLEILPWEAISFIFYLFFIFLFAFGNLLLSNKQLTD